MTTVNAKLIREQEAFNTLNRIRALAKLKKDDKQLGRVVRRIIQQYEQVRAAES